MESLAAAGKALSAVLSGGGIGFKHGNVFYPNAAVGYVFQTAIRLVVKILRQIFRRWIDDGERLDIVDHLMVEAFDDVLHHFAEILEIEQQSGFVEFRARERDPDLVIVPVRIFTLALVVAQVMARRKRIVNCNFEHASLCGSTRLQDGPRRIAKHLIVPLTPSILLDSTAKANQ